MITSLTGTDVKNLTVLEISRDLLYMYMYMYQLYWLINLFK